MAVGNGVPYNTHTGNGVTDTFAYEFTLLDADDLVVTLDGNAVSTYTLTGVGNAGGGTVVFDDPPANGAAILLKRVIDLVRTTAYQDNGDFRPAVVNSDFDRLVMALQEVAAKVGGSVRAPYPEQLAEIASKAARANSVDGWDADGNRVQLIGVDSAAAAALQLYLADGETTGRGAELVRFKVTADNSVERSIYARIIETRSLADWLPEGYVSDGSTAYTAQIQAAVDECGSYAVTTNGRNGFAIAELVLPPGRWDFTGVKISRPMRIRGQGMQTSSIRTRNGTTQAALLVEVSHDGFDYYTANGLPAIVEIKDLLITSESAVDAPGIGVAHGIHCNNAASNPVTTYVYLDNVFVFAMPGCGIFGDTGFSGAVFARRFFVKYCHDDLLRAYSCADWRIEDFDFGGGTNCIALSTCAQFKFSHGFAYVPNHSVVNAFGGCNVNFTDCDFDLAGRSCVAANLVPPGSYQATLIFNTCYFRWASQSSNGGYATFEIVPGTGGVIKLLGCEFRSLNNLFGANVTSADLLFTSSGVGCGTRVYVDEATVFDRGVLGVASNITNRLDYIKGLGSQGAVNTTNELYAAGDIIMKGGFLSDPNYVSNTPTTGSTQTIASGKTAYLATPAGTLAALTVQFPPPTRDGQEFVLASTQELTALTVSAQSPATTVFNPPTTLAAGGFARFKYLQGGLSWMRVG